MYKHLHAILQIWILINFSVEIDSISKEISYIDTAVITIFWMKYRSTVMNTVNKLKL